jgi:PhnB protein
MAVSAQLSGRRGRDAVAYYVDIFGAEVIYQVGGTEDEPPIVAQLRLDGTTFWVSDEAPEVGNYSPESLGGGTVKLLLQTDDPTSVHARATAAGATDVGAVKPEHGWLIGRIVDPFGYTWEIGKPLGPWPPSPR